MNSNSAHFEQAANRVSNGRATPAQALTGAFAIALSLLAAVGNADERPVNPRLRVIVETDAAGDPDDEQSLVRFLLYANEWDVEGIIANRAAARDGENENAERTGLGIVQALVSAYAECWPNLRVHDPRYPAPEVLRKRTVAGYDDTNDGVELILAAVDRDDPRPIWYSDWGTDSGGGKNNLRRALDRVLAERGPEAYAAFKSRLRLTSADAFGEHTRAVAPPFVLWVDTFRPEQNGKRWYHTFSGITATAGGFDVERDLRTGHGPLGALYPLNTTHRQKEGDTMTFLYLVPTGMSDAAEPTWGSWAGRYGVQPDAGPRAYYWASQQDAWNGSTSRENSLARFAAAIQNDFAARADWCVADTYAEANHPPVPTLRVGREPEGSEQPAASILKITVQAGQRVELSAAGSSDPDGDRLSLSWFVYPEAGTCPDPPRLDAAEGATTGLTTSADGPSHTLHVVLVATDHGTPQLTRYRRAVITVADGRPDERPSAWRETASLPAAEAGQAAAADERFVYAISNRSIGKYDRRTGQRVATSTGPATHLNSGFIREGQLYCAHSNYPAKPERSEILVLDPDTMQLREYHRFVDQPGSLTWAVYHAGAWWCFFAFYDADNVKSYLARFDDTWRETARWTLPARLLERLGRHSLSGGVWHGERLLVSDHDHYVIYELEVPAAAKTAAAPGELKLLAARAAPFAGQGIARDPLGDGLVGIVRSQRRIVFARLEPLPR